ncbi:MAG: hypothetical protein ACK4WF_03000 [Candidatus Brocadiales bacterium]
MRKSFLTLCVSVLFLMFSLMTLAGGQEIKTIGGKEFNDLLAANKGKVVVLDFWATF